VFVVEEPLFDSETAFLDVILNAENVEIITPHLPSGLNENEIVAEQGKLLQEFFAKVNLKNYIAWYYTPMAMPLGEALPAADLVVYDCMDELSAFKNAPTAIKEKEAALLQKADLVFTGGYHLYEAKKDLHPDIHPFPSSIDKKHFANARTNITVPFDHLDMPHPRIGFFGVIDERLNIELLGQLAVLKPGWQFILIGPTVKIDPAILPVSPNIHYLGSRSYADLPVYLSGWDVALIPFALNESTRFISPTKTPEYLAGGVPVVSTSIRDVVKPYGENNLVYIADTPAEFIKGIEWGLSVKNDPVWLKAVDNFLADVSWDITWKKMITHIERKLEAKQPGNLIQKRSEYV
jgi:UDP-galactopyranose mutase